MRAVIQRVKQASVSLAHKKTAEIEHGMLVFLSIDRDDSDKDVLHMADKIMDLRIFDDDQGFMNLSIKNTNGEILVVSQFTLHGDCRKGRRPSFSTAAPSEKAKRLYEDFVSHLRQQNISIKTGEFQAKMEIALINDGPVTLLLDSKKVF